MMIYTKLIQEERYCGNQVLKELGVGDAYGTSYKKGIVTVYLKVAIGRIGY